MQRPMLGSHDMVLFAAQTRTRTLLGTQIGLSAYPVALVPS